MPEASAGFPESMCVTVVRALSADAPEPILVVNQEKIGSLLEQGGLLPNTFPVLWLCSSLTCCRPGNTDNCDLADSAVNTLTFVEDPVR
jgi:hypothetical protein